MKKYILLIVLLLIVFPVTGLAATIEMFSDDFQGETPGDLPDGYSITVKQLTDMNNDSADAKIYSSVNPLVVMSAKASVPGNSRARIVISRSSMPAIPAGISDFTLSYMFYGYVEADAVGEAYVDYSCNGYQVKITYITPTGVLSIATPSGSEPLGTYAQDEFHNIVVDMDTAAGTCDVTIGSTTVTNIFLPSSSVSHSFTVQDQLFSSTVSNKITLFRFDDVVASYDDGVASDDDGAGNIINNPQTGETSLLETIIDWFERSSFGSKP